MPQKIDECCAVIDALAVVSGHTMTKLLDSLESDNGSITSKKPQQTQ